MIRTVIQKYKKKDIKHNQLGIALLPKKEFLHGSALKNRPFQTPQPREQISYYFQEESEKEIDSRKIPYKGNCIKRKNLTPHFSNIQ